MKKTVLITGAMGTTGTYAIEFLKTMDVELKVMVKNLDERSAALEKQGIEVIKGDFLDYNSLKNALKDVDSAYFCYPFQDYLPKATAYFAKAAEKNGTSLIVNMSQMNVHEGSTSPATQNHLVSEQIFDWCTVKTIHLRPALFAWNYLGMAAPTISQQNTFYFPDPKTGYSIIHPADIGEVIATLLTKTKFKLTSNVVDITGGKTYTNESLTDLFSSLLGREIVYTSIPVDAWYEAVKTLPDVNDYLATHLREFFSDIEAGKFNRVTTAVNDITGHEPTPISDYFKQNLSLFN